MRVTRGLLSVLCCLVPGMLRADTMYSFSGTYSPYTVSISFDTSLTGSALDNLSSDNITSTVSGFMETNTIPGNGSASLNVTISTDSMGNITTFSITDTTDQVVTNTEDSGETAGTPATYQPPSIPGDTLITFISDNGALIASYFDNNSGASVVCSYFDGVLLNADGGSCPSNAPETAGTPPAPVSASGSGMFTSNPPNPGEAQSAVPEISSSALLSTLVGFLALAAWRRARRTAGAPPIPLAIAPKG